MKKRKLALSRKLNLGKETITPLDQRRANQIAGGSFNLTGCAETLEVLFCPTRDVNSITPACCVIVSNNCNTFQQSCGACPVETKLCP